MLILYFFLAVFPLFSPLDALTTIVSEQYENQKFERLQTLHDGKSLQEERFWLFNVDWDDGKNRLVDPNKIAREYSLMKYGDPKATRRFARMLAERFVKLALTPGYFGPRGITDWSRVKIGTLYWDLKLPAAYLSEEFFNQVNGILFSKNLPPVTLVKFTRHYQQKLGFDYGATSDTRVRDAENSKQRYTWDKDLVKSDDHLIMIDDCIVTGGHEKTVRRDLFTLTEYGHFPKIGRVTWGYIAKVPVSIGSSKAEDALNTAFVKKVDNIIEISDQYPNKIMPSLRMLKFIYRKSHNLYEFSHVMTRIAVSNTEAVAAFFHGGINSMFPVEEPSTRPIFEVLKRVIHTVGNDFK